jgi:hypothetical protein
VIHPRLLEEARSLDLATTAGRFRMGDLAFPGDKLDDWAAALGAPRSQVSECWFLAMQYPPEHRHPELDWAVFDMLALSPDRFRLVDLAAAKHWTITELDDYLSDQFEAEFGFRPSGAERRAAK